MAPDSRRGRGPASRLFLEDTGRARAGWRLAGFVLLFLVVLGALGLAAGWLLPTERLEEAPLWWGALLALVAALVTSWSMARLERVPLAALGLPVDLASLREVAAGLLLGGLVMAVAVALLAGAGWASWSLADQPLGAIAVGVARLGALLAAAALAEELLFRGYPFQLLAEGLGGIAALAITSVVFGLLHAGNPFAAPLPLVNITLAGVLLGLAYWKTWSLWFATGLHFGWNWTMGGLAGLPVSGLDLSPPGFEASVHGPDVWTGGAFGPEGGLVVTFVTVGAIIWLWRTDRVRPSLRVLALRPLPTRGRGEGGRGTMGMERSMQGRGRE